LKISWNRNVVVRFVSLTGLMLSLWLFMTGCGGTPTNPGDQGASNETTGGGTGGERLADEDDGNARVPDVEPSAPEQSITSSEEPPMDAKEPSSPVKPETSDGLKAKGSGNTAADSGQSNRNTEKPPKGRSPQTHQEDSGAVKVVANPHEVTVLVNKTYRLPDNYRPADLVEPNVPFIFQEKSEKRLLRKEAAEALEALFAAAKADGIHLAGVSGFRSHDTQKWLFEYYVKTRGEAEARRISAMPGHSEHQTGLAMDVSGIDGRCAAQDCFAGTEEARWLEKHAHEYGFIIRYPKGKEAITGYKYEPWHLRYVGKSLAQTLVQSGLTLDEYLQGTVPVSNESP